jgi:hypothetical protein
METNRLFADDGIGFARDRVYFESTRREKIQRLTELQCTHFIDDLEETFLEDSFPANVDKILFAPVPGISPSGMKVFQTWGQISDFFFNAS